MDGEKLQSIMNGRKIDMDIKSEQPCKAVEDISMPKRDLYAQIEGSFKDLLQSRTSGNIPAAQSNQEGHDKFTNSFQAVSEANSPSRRLLPFEKAQGASVSAIVGSNMGEISVVESDHGQFYSLANIEVDPSDKYNSNPTNEKIPNQIGTDEVSRLMAQVNDLEQEKRGIQRLLKSENHDLADKELDLEQLRNKLKKKQREYDLLNDNHEELKQLMSDLSERYKEVVREGNIIANREKGLLEQLEFQEEERQKLFNTQKVANKEKKNLEDELETTNVKHQILLKKLEAFEKYEIELIQTSHEHAHQLEEAYFARDAALQKASTTQKQVESLSDKLNSQPKFYQEKHEVAMENLRTQFGIERKRFCESGAKMEQLISKLRSDLDRALREKRAAESEVEKITKHLPEEGNRMNIAFDELHSKLNSAEKERLEAEQRLEALQSNFKQEQSRYELELFQANETNENNYRRLKRLENELEEANKQSILAHKRIAELEYENSQLNDQLKQTKQFQATESKHTQAKMQSQIADLELKLENSLKANDTSKNDIQRLLALQQTLSDKWKQESLQFKEHYEEIIKKLQSELVHYRQQCSELEGRYQASRNQCKQTLQQISKEKQLYSQLHDHFLAAKENINQAARKLNQMKAAEAELVVHKKQLVRENDQLKFELDAQRRRQAAGDRRSIQSVLDEIKLPNQSVHKGELNILEKHIDKVQGRVLNRNSDFEKYQDTSDST